MCFFTYHRYEECNHRVISLAQLCRPKLWSAGMSGTLLACPEKWYTSVVVDGSSEFNLRWRWIGMKGWCLGCNSQFLTDTTLINTPSYQDEIFNLFHTFDESWEEPFIHLPAIYKTVPELLGLSSQYRYECIDSPKDEGDALHFKKKFQIYNSELPQNRMQWLRGDPSIDNGPYTIQGTLYEMNGFSTHDIEIISQRIREKYRGSDVYDSEFRARGMPKSVFDEMTKKIVAQYKEVHSQHGMQWIVYWNA